ncbi:MAG: hypothetical protein WC505_07130 [Patescibacteria group bacterium]
MEKKKLERPILADGELTGHVHELADPEVEVYEVDNGTREFTIANPTQVTHQEHGAVTLPAGAWASDRVVEYDPFNGERKVMD